MRMRFILLSFLLFISCDRRELTYYEVVGVTLMADWSQADWREKTPMARRPFSIPKMEECLKPY
mgnify:FL=1